MGVDAEVRPKLEPPAQAPFAKTKNKRDGLYVHPKGSVLKPIKVSCASCISGHRSGECNHFDRILLQIRAAGRPSNTCHHNLSCGGSCLKQRAFTIPHEEPKWCRNHRSCIENWEYSEHCPPYPVSTKRKGRSSSPTRPSRTLTASPTAAKGVDDKSAISHRAATSSRCSPQISVTTPQHHPLPILPVGQPIMATASTHLPPTGWSPKSSIVRNTFTTSFDHPPILASESEAVVPSSAQAPLPQFPETPSFSILDPYGFTFTRLTDKTNPTYGASSHAYMDDSASYQDDLATAHHHEFTSMANSNPAPTYLSLPPATSTATAKAPQHHQPHSQNQEPQQCPGNGFQCPCDENCMCADCYTHGRGFWTLPVDLDHV